MKAFLTETPTTFLFNIFEITSLIARGAKALWDIDMTVTESSLNEDSHYHCYALSGWEALPQPPESEGSTFCATIIDTAGHPYHVGIDLLTMNFFNPVTRDVFPMDEAEFSIDRVNEVNEVEQSTDGDDMVVCPACDGEKMNDMGDSCPLCLGHGFISEEEYEEICNPSGATSQEQLLADQSDELYQKGAYCGFTQAEALLTGYGSTLTCECCGTSLTDHSFNENHLIKQ